MSKTKEKDNLGRGLTNPSIGYDKLTQAAIIAAKCVKRSSHELKQQKEHRKQSRYEYKKGQ